MFKKLWGLHSVYFVMLVVLGAQTVVFSFLSTPVFYVSLLIFLCVTTVAVIRVATMGHRINRLIRSINEDLDSTTSNALACFNLPVLIVSSMNEIIWYNSNFSQVIDPEAEALVGKNIIDLIGSKAAEDLKSKQKASFTFGQKILDVYETVYKVGGEDQRILCFVDLTGLKKIASEYKLSRSVVAFIAIDNLDELTRNLRDSERNNVISKIQNVLEDWFSTVNGISRRMSGEKYLFIFEERDLISFISNKFDILNRVRKIDFGDRGKATISIGIGHGKNLHECEEQAALSLDMALGRGGDQVAIKNSDNTFRFFGGISGGSEKRTRVRARIVASSLIDMASSSEQIVLMGHKFADLDCYGSAFALCSAIRKNTGKPASVVLNKKTALVKPLLDRISVLGVSTMTVDPEDIIHSVNKQTLLIVLDTHRPALLECPELLELAGKIVVIDHHRKAVDFIQNTAIFYHEPAASSASEMVCELIQYIDGELIGRAEAEAMLSGITLDTKNYCMNTGVRTFEASAFLRRRGADPIAVKKLFSDSIDNYKIKNSVISTAEQYKNCAIAVNSTDVPTEEKKIVSSQAADELLNISGIKASFVISNFDDIINISARSYGEINVQIIMELLGGGGHSTMAACQISDSNIDSVKEMLLKAIDKTQEG